MALHKLLADDFEDSLFSLLAIHCTIEDYRVAYLLNKYLNISLKRKPFDLDFENESATYSLFEWEDKERLFVWNLVSNMCKKEDEETVQNTGSLFHMKHKIQRFHNLIPEYKKASFLLKIDTDGMYINERAIINRIQDIPQIVTVYSIDVSQLKSKDNLIFN